MRINLEKELLSQNKRLMLPEELLVVREYERQTTLEDDAVLTRMGLNRTIRAGKEIKSRVNSKRQQSEKFDQSRVFHISQIEGICKKYYLRFLPTHHYQGTIDADLPTKITTFEIAHGFTCTDSNTFIIAPKESFKLEEKPKDPLMFYRINDEYFYLIHKWGNDLSLTRRMMPLLSSKIFTWAVVVLFWAILGYLTDGFLRGHFQYVLAGLLAGITIFIGSAHYDIHHDRPFTFLPKNKWNSEYTW